MRSLRVLTAAAAAAGTLAVGIDVVHAGTTTRAKTYAHRLATERGWRGYEILALDRIVEGTPGRDPGESNWHPCAVYPSTTDCGYRGANSCGIPQATPCPTEWRGRLATTWRAQVRWLLDYIGRRYGRPSAAYAYHLAHHSY